MRFGANTRAHCGLAGVFGWCQPPTPSGPYETVRIRLISRRWGGASSRAFSAELRHFLHGRATGGYSPGQSRQSMPWSQNYDPLGAWPLSTAVAALPVVTLFFVLVGLRARV